MVNTLFLGGIACLVGGTLNTSLGGSPYLWVMYGTFAFFGIVGGLFIELWRYLKK